MFKLNSLTGKPVLLFLLLLFMPNSCSNSDNPSGVDQAVEKPWTFLLYDDADFPRAYDPLDDFCMKVCSNEVVNFLVLVDSEIGPAAYGFIDENHNPVKVKELGEVNMGSAETLQDFLIFAREEYPAERYIISFYDHGGGWRGACWDITSENDNLTMIEMKEAFTETGGVDLVLFSAPCLMGAFESAFNLRNCTDVYIGSENLSGYAWWKEPMDDICKTLQENPGITNYQLGEGIINSIWEHHTRYESESLTMSAVRTDRLEIIADVLDELSLEYLARLDTFRTHIDSIYQNITSFSSSIVDLYDLAEELLSVEEDQQVRGILFSLQQSIEDAIIAECHGLDWPDAHGLTIFFPDSSSAMLLPSYISTKYGLDSVLETHWDELLFSLLEPAMLSKRGVMEFNPPQSNGFIVPGKRDYIP